MTLVDFLGVGDVGTIVNPRSLIAQINGGCCLGIAHALYQKLVYDPHYGLVAGAAVPSQQADDDPRHPA